MRKKVFSFVTSYPFLLIGLVACFAVQSSYGQAFFTGSPVTYIYDWCKALPVQDMFLPVLAIPKENFIPGPVQIGAGQLTDLVKIAVISTDSATLINTDTDSSETKDAAAGNQSLMGAAALVVENPTTVVAGKASSDLSGALFDEETDLLITKYAEMISVAPDEVNNFRLYKFIDNWYGVRYKWGGNDNTGIDCSGFSQKLYGSIYGLTLLRTARQQHRNCEIIKEYGEASEGDLVFFRVHHLGISHVGIYLANGYFVHASRSRGVTISNLDDKYWRRRYAGCGRVEREDLSGTESGFLQ